MASYGHQGQQPPRLPDRPDPPDLMACIDDALLTVEWLKSSSFASFGQYSIQDNDEESKRTVTLPAAVEGFDDAERMQHLHPTTDDHDLLVSIPADASTVTDLVTTEPLNLVNRYKIHNNTSPAAFTIPQRMEAFDGSETVYQFQMTAGHQPLLVVPGGSATVDE